MLSDILLPKCVLSKKKFSKYVVSCNYWYIFHLSCAFWYFLAALWYKHVISCTNICFGVQVGNFWYDVLFSVTNGYIKVLARALQIKWVNVLFRLVTSPKNNYILLEVGVLRLKWILLVNNKKFSYKKGYYMAMAYFLL